MCSVKDQHRAEVELIARSLPAEARVALLSLMGEVVNALTNLDATCPHEAVYCRRLIRLDRARLLLEALNRVHEADESNTSQAGSATGR